MTPVTQYCGKSGRLEFNPINYMLPSLTIPTYTSTLDASTASPELIEFCREYGILHYKLQAFFTNANIVRSLCHIDVHNITQQSQPRINWVLTAPSSYMQWFDTSSALPVPKPRDSLDYTAYDCRPLAPLHTEYMRGGTSLRLQSHTSYKILPQKHAGVFLLPHNLLLAMFHWVNYWLD
jgi:hypothetical protein